MKVLINKTHEIEVDEKFRDMFPMKGCKDRECKGCPFNGFFCCQLNSEIIEGIVNKDYFIAEIIEDKKAEIVEDKIDFSKLTIAQEIYFQGSKLIIWGLEIDYPLNRIRVGALDWIEFNPEFFSLTPPPKKKVTKTVEAWAFVDLKTNKVEYLSNYENDYTNNFVKVKLSGNYVVGE